jgi:hypothetical protein
MICQWNFDWHAFGCSADVWHYVDIPTLQNHICKYLHVARLFYVGIPFHKGKLFHISTPPIRQTLLQCRQTLLLCRQSPPLRDRLFQVGRTFHAGTPSTPAHFLLHQHCSPLHALRTTVVRNRCPFSTSPISHTIYYSVPSCRPPLGMA